MKHGPAWLAKLYFGLFSSAFTREHRSVLAGIMKYHQIEQSQEANWFLLRRNTHRLEKGLLMRPMRDVFALNYIEETMTAYVQASAWIAQGADEAERTEWQWAHDVLAEYFRVTGSHPTIDGLRERFRALADSVMEGGTCKPYHRDLAGEPPVSYDQMLALAHRRRSVRWYRPDPVPRDLVDKAIQVAAQAPSACNRQPFVYRIFDEPDKVQALASLPMGTRGFKENFPMILAIVGRQRAYFSPRDRHLIYIDGSLSAMSLMLALETLGLSSCPINWPDMKDREKKVAKLLALDPDERVVMLMSIGYPDPEGKVAFSHKKDLDRIRSYNT